MNASYATPNDSLTHAVTFATGAAIALPIMDGIVKSLATVYPVILIAWSRFAVMSFVLIAVGARRQGWRQFRTDAPLLQLLRAVLIVAATGCFYTGLQHLPLAECSAIMFLAPALSALLAYVWLHERPTRLAWIAIGISLLGVLIVSRPGGRMFDTVALYPLGGALAYAVFLLVTRVLAQRDAPHATTLWSALGALAAFSVAVPDHWVPLQDGADLVLLVCVGLLGAAGQLLFSLAYRHGRTHVVAPLTYLSLPVALAVGWVGFGEIPDGWSMLGIGMIGGAALLVALGRTTR